jgi:hypothetical protein
VLIFYHNKVIKPNRLPAKNISFSIFTRIFFITYIFIIMIIFENIKKNRGQTKLFKYITLGKDLDDDEIDNIMKATDKIISKNKNDIDETL